MKVTVSTKSIFRGFLFALLAISFTAPVSAQSVLQDTSSSIQSQTGQTQNSASTQSQTGSVQQNSGQTIIGEAGLKPLGVVSDPKQAAPSSVVQPSTTLRTDISDSKPHSTMRYVIGFLFALTILMGVATFLVNRPTRALRNTDNAQTDQLPQNLNIPELSKPIHTAPRKKQTRKQRKKKQSQK